MNKRDDLEAVAKVYALDKAKDISGTVVDAVLNRTSATIPDLKLIREAEAYIERFLTAVLKNSIVEFTSAWTAETCTVEMEKLNEDTAGRS
jgi:hypothetical protein